MSPQDYRRAVQMERAVKKLADAIGVETPETPSNPPSTGSELYERVDKATVEFSRLVLRQREQAPESVKKPTPEGAASQAKDEEILTSVPNGETSQNEKAQLRERVNRLIAKVQTMEFEMERMQEDINLIYGEIMELQDALKKAN